MASPKVDHALPQGQAVPFLSELRHDFATSGRQLEHRHMSSPPPRTDIPSLTGLRGVAALMVVLYHANESFIRASGYASPHIFHGRLFVDLFYVLSGFVLCHVYVTDT